VIAALAPSLPLALMLLFIRSALSQLDVQMRPAYVMSAVTSPERAAAASMTGRAAQPGRVAETFAGRLALCGQLAGFDSRQPSGHHILRSLRNGRIWPK
jgi:uncharacterized heparinase superfamily protein